MIKLEEAKYASICGFVLANKEPFMDAGIFDLGLFWTGQKSALPVHYSLWLAEVGCAKVASANVEVVFSCAGRISMKSLCLDLQLFSDYAFLIYNYKYDWLRPKLEEIVAAYLWLYDKECAGPVSFTAVSQGLGFRLFRLWGVDPVSFTVTGENANGEANKC